MCAVQISIHMNIEICKWTSSIEKFVIKAHITPSCQLRFSLKFKEDLTILLWGEGHAPHGRIVTLTTALPCAFTAN